MPGVTPALEAPSALDESAKPSPVAGPAETLPAPGSSGVTAPPIPAAGPLGTKRPDDAEYGGAVAIAAEVLVLVVEYDGALPADRYAAEYGGGLTAGAVEFIEVGPISVVLKGVSPPLLGADSIAPGFSGPGGAGGPP